MKKIEKMNEAAWLLGIIICAFGICLCTKANFGLSMIAAAPYSIYRKISIFIPWYTQGMSEYVWQAVLVILMCIAIRRFKFKYILSFITAVLCGLAIDAWFTVLGGNAPYTDMTARIIAFIVGETMTAIAIAFYFRTTMPLQIYELLVVEIADKFSLDKDKTKLWSDIIMFIVSVSISLILHKNLTGIGIGTGIITIVNARLIYYAGVMLDKCFVFNSRFPKFTEMLGK